MITTIKDEAKRIIDNLPENAKWEDLMYEIYVREKIEKGLQAVERGDFVSSEEAEKRLFGNAG